MWESGRKIGSRNECVDSGSFRSSPTRRLQSSTARPAKKYPRTILDFGFVDFDGYTEIMGKEKLNMPGVRFAKQHIRFLQQERESLQR
jgi:hypothetical protein